MTDTAQAEQIEPERTHDRIPEFARRPVLAIAGGVGITLLVVSGRYGYFGDELYFLATGRQLSWGYADQPWLVPLLARVLDTVTGGSLVGLRLPAVAATAGGVVVTALVARELGGGRRAQIMAAATFATSLYLIATGHVLTTATLDPLGWMTIIWLVVRWVRTRAEGRPDDRLLLLAGVVTALTLQVKFLIPAFWLALGSSVLALGPRDLLRRPMLWAGAAIAVVVTLPTLRWQARHGWPYLDLARQISHEADPAGGRGMFLPLVVVSGGAVIGGVLLCYGMWRLLRSPELRPYRFLGATVLGVTAIMIVSNGRPTYLAGCYGLLWAVAAVELQRHRPARWWRWVPTWPVYALSAVLALSTLPWEPVAWHAGQPSAVDTFKLDEIGWPEVVDSIAAARQALPPAARHAAAVVSDTYWVASAVERFGPERGLPESYSPQRGYYYLGTPPESARTIIFVGSDADRLGRHFTEVRGAGKVNNRFDVNNSTQGVPIWICTGPRAPWSQLWPQLRSM